MKAFINHREQHEFEVPAIKSRHGLIVIFR